MNRAKQESRSYFLKEKVGKDLFNFGKVWTKFSLFCPKWYSVWSAQIKPTKLIIDSFPIPLLFAGDFLFDNYNLK